MTVLMFSTQWPEYMIGLANAMTRHCRTVLMLPRNHRLTDLHRSFIAQEVTFIDYDVVFHRSIRDNARMLISILRAVWKIRPDVLHIQANGHRLFYWVYLLKPWGVKILNTVHDPVKHMGDAVSERISDSAAVFWGRLFTSKYVVHGTYLRSLLSQQYRVKAERISVIPHGALSIYKNFQQKPVEREASTVLFFGRIWPYKGLGVFIEACNRVADLYPEATFLIVGQGENIAGYRSMIRDPSRFEIINTRVPPEEVGSYFQRASMVVLPYLEATQSGVIPVAYAYGRPVIVTAVGSLPEVVEDGVTGFVVQPNCPEVLAEKVLALLRDPVRCSSMGRAADLYAKRNLSWEIVAEATFGQYIEVTT